MNFKPDPYQQDYLDYILPPKSVTKLIANAGCVHPDTEVTILVEDEEVLDRIFQLLKRTGKYNVNNRNNNQQT